MASRNSAEEADSGVSAHSPTIPIWDEFGGKSTPERLARSHRARCHDASHLASLSEEVGADFEPSGLDLSQREVKVRSRRLD